MGNKCHQRKINFSTTEDHIYIYIYMLKFKPIMTRVKYNNKGIKN